MTLKCLNQYTASLILACLTLVVCAFRSEFLISVLKDTTDPKREVNAVINTLLYVNLVVYIILGLLCLLLIYAIIKKRHILMIPWLVAALLNVACEILFVIYVLIKGHRKGVLFLMIGPVLTVWVIWAICCFYRTVRREDETQRSDELRCLRNRAARRIEIY